MKRSIVILSLAFALTLSVFAQAPPARKGEKLSDQQLLALISNAKTSSEHTRLAQYYEAKAKDYLAQSKEHEQMASAYRKNPVTSNSKFATGTVNHCDYLTQSFRDNATKMQELAQMHLQMAKDTGQK